MKARRFGALLILALVPACGETNRPFVSGALTGDAGTEDTGVSWSQDVWPIIIVNCQVCHTTGSGSKEVPDMLMTDPSTLYNAWVNVATMCSPTPILFRVLPGESDLSFVFNKISQVAPFCGAQMPLLGPPLDDSEQQTIQDWINQGARHN